VSEKYANRKKAKAHVNHQAKVVPADLRPRAKKKTDIENTRFRKLEQFQA
jgi:hypothetical protein